MVQVSVLCGAVAAWTLCVADASHAAAAAAPADLASLEQFLGASVDTTFSQDASNVNRVISPRPWSGFTWRAIRDGINQWLRIREPSPAEKYARAFDLDVTKFMDAVSLESGVDLFSKNATCTFDTDCPTPYDYAACAKREGKTSGYCGDGRIGVRQGAALAAVLEPEPKCDVSKNGVLFRTVDIKALLSQVYEKAETGSVLLSSVTPVTFHLALATLMGQKGVSVVFSNDDFSTFTNRPLTFYNASVNNVSTPDAFVAARNRTLLPETKSVAEMTFAGGMAMDTDASGFDNYFPQAIARYYLELDSNSRIVGGGWITTYRVSILLVGRKPAKTTATSYGLTYEKVLELLNASLDCTSTPAPTTLVPVTTDPDIAGLDVIKRFHGPSLELRFDQHVAKYMTGSSKPMPWSSYRWQALSDGINYRLKGAVESPAEKYAKAFGLSVRRFSDWISAYTGVDSQATNAKCEIGTWCPSLGSYDVCAKRRDVWTGYCTKYSVDIWEGTVVAAMLEEEPKCNVEKGTVSFTPLDIKALMAQVYAVSELGNVWLEKTNPAAFHLAVVNGIGRRGKPMLLSDKFRTKVSLVSYNMKEVKLLQMSELPFNSDLSQRQYKPETVTLAKVTMDIEVDHSLNEDGSRPWYNRVTQVYYYLELDASSRVIGGGWMYSLQQDQFVSLQLLGEKKAVETKTHYGLSYQNVKTLLDASVKCVSPPPEPTTPAPTTPNPTTPAPTTPKPTTPVPTTPKPTTPAPTTPAPTTPVPTTPVPTTPKPTTPAPTTPAPTTPAPTTPAPTTPAPTTPVPTTPVPTTPAPTTPAPTTPAPTTPAPTSAAPVSGGPCGNANVGALPCPAGEFCQPWNPSFYQCRPAPAQCDVQEVGVDYYGQDLDRVAGVLPWECCDKCAATPGCKAYTFINYNGENTPSMCYLKTGVGEKRRLTGAVSSTVKRPKPLCSTPQWGTCGSASTGATCCPDDSYCQPWNEGFFQCAPKPAKCSRLATGVDFYGEDLAQVFGVGPWECCDRCASTPGCKAYTFVNNNPGGQPACYLKKGVGERRTHPTAVSGLLDG
ncbi:hypothetical protein PINS_up014426 [Pythium insidiosum]|nr:hypothetical protein PINS_up014426 [Pythium insidiosum]